MRFIADGVAVTFHYPDLMRITGARAPSAGSTAQGSARCAPNCVRRRLGALIGRSLATLADVLRLGRVHGGALNVELKNLPGQPGFDATGAAAARLAALLRAARIVPGRLTVQSFWAPDLEQLGRLLPQARASLLVAPGGEADGIERALMARRRCRRAGRGRCPPDAVRHARDCGLGVMAYTLNEPAAVRDA